MSERKWKHNFSLSFCYLLYTKNSPGISLSPIFDQFLLFIVRENSLYFAHFIFRRFFESMGEQPELWPIKLYLSAFARFYVTKTFTIPTRLVHNVLALASAAFTEASVSEVGLRTLATVCRTARKIRGRDITVAFSSPGCKTSTINGRKLR